MSTLALVVESVDGSDLPGLVVSSEEGDAVWVLQLEAQEQLKGFNGVVATIDEVTHENVSIVRDLSTLFKELEMIVELTVDVTADGNGGTDGLHVALLNEDLLDFLAQDAQVSFWQDATILDCCEPRVNITFSGGHNYLLL